MEPITIETTIRASLAEVWRAFTDPEAVTQWNHASDDWHSPRAENDLRPGGRFSYRMEAKDGSEGFDFTGVYDEVINEKRIAYTMGDGRTVTVDFSMTDDGVRVVESFAPEREHSLVLQRSGWQSILDSLKRYVENGS